MKLSKKTNVGLTVALVAAAAVVITLLDLKIIGSTYVTNISSSAPSTPWWAPP